jgi:hypothetical protein
MPEQVAKLMEELLQGGAAELGVTLKPGAGAWALGLYTRSLQFFTCCLWCTAAVERLHAYARSVAHFPTALKEVKMSVKMAMSLTLLPLCPMCLQPEWRNGWFKTLSESAVSKGREDPFPYHSALLAQAGSN